jgi:predicted DNA-binding transcriptional regulator AlpA
MDMIDYDGIRQLTGMAPSTVKIAISSRGFPKGSRLGRRKQWSREMVVDWMNKQLRKGK